MSYIVLPQCLLMSIFKFSCSFCIVSKVSFIFADSVSPPCNNAISIQSLGNCVPVQSEAVEGVATASLPTSPLPLSIRVVSSEISVVRDILVRG